MADSHIYLVSGLGNPGGKYARTRHNIGFMVVDELSRRFSISLSKKRFNAEFGKTRISGESLVLAKPQSFMNLSGPPLQQLSAYFKVKSQDIIVIHDDLDLPFGRIRIVKDRGHGGHNGIRSITQALGTRDYIRVRAGVGRPRGEKGVTSHVLGRFSSSEEPLLNELIEAGADACVTILKRGVQAAMNSFNTRKK